MNVEPPQSLASIELQALQNVLHEFGFPKFRAKQVHQWVHQKGVLNPQEMTNLPSALRKVLEEHFTPMSLKVVEEQISVDGTIKRLYALHDGQKIESVLMPYHSVRRTACISSQAGCAMGCTFCATGQMGFSRQLTADEIFEQAAVYAAHLRTQDERLSNVVLMGMGEPFHNYDNVLIAIRRIISELGIGARHITVSTVGLAPKIRQFAEEGLQVTLAISLHAASDDVRGKMLPINRKHPINDVLDACDYYVAQTNRRVTYEWALIEGKNDDERTARSLGHLLKGRLCHVNLIPLNPTGGYDGTPTGHEAAGAFVDVLAEYGVSATLRVRRGIDIDAGCGQLKAKNQKT